jgi:hypothetical protein
MKIKDLLAEGMTFNPVIEKDFDGEKAWGNEWQHQEEQDCWACDGKGKDEYSDGESYPCMRCNGTGKHKEWVSAAPELQVSNRNGELIQEFLGLDPDYSGVIRHEQLPAIMRKLIQLKNQGSSKHTIPASDEQGPMRSWKDDQGQSHIGRGAQMIDPGVPQSQISRYIDKLIEIVKFAQENNAGLGWG